MLKLIARRLIGAIPTLWIVATLTFMLIHLAPGGPFDNEVILHPETERALQSYYGLDLPLYQQYTQFLGQLVQGNLGPSLKHPGYTVNEMIASKLLVSADLGLRSGLVAVFFGCLIGMLAAQVRQKWLERLILGFMDLGICLPSFVIGPLLIWIFGIQLKWLPATGWSSVQHTFLPVVTLSLFYTAYVARIMRSSILSTQGQLYLRTAHAKGLSSTKIWSVHILKNALSPVIAYLAPLLAALVTGSIVVETIFNVPGLGRCFWMATNNRDYGIIFGVVLLYAAILLCASIISDLLIAWLNPKIRLEA